MFKTTNLIKKDKNKKNYATFKARAAVANPIVSNVIDFRLRNTRTGTSFCCAITIMCFSKSNGSTLASSKTQHTLCFSKARVTAFIPIIMDFLKTVHIKISSISL